MYSAAVIGISAFAVAALAQSPDITVSTPGDTISNGQSYALAYSAPAAGPAVNIDLLTGCPSNCMFAQTINPAPLPAGAGTYQWTVNQPATSGYGLRVSNGNIFNYSGNFTVAGGSTAPPPPPPPPAMGYTSAPVSAPAPTGYGSTPVTQLPDNQPIAAPSAPAVSSAISQIADNQPKAPTSAPAASSSVTPVYPIYTPVYTPVRSPVATPPAMYTGAASQQKVGAGLLGVAGVAGLFML